MRRIVLFGLLSAICISYGCIYKFNNVRPSPGTENNQPVAIEEGKNETVKQPLFKKPRFTAEETAEEEHPVESRLKLAREYLDKKLYDKIPPVLDEIAMFDPDNKEAAEISNEAYYGMGLVFYNRRQYIASKAALSRVPLAYKDTRSLLAALKAVMEREADIHYKRGVKFFINEQLTNAIAEWEKVLALDPGHLKAGEDIENARQLLKKVEKINQQPDVSESP